MQLNLAKAKALRFSDLCGKIPLKYNGRSRRAHIRNGYA
jgi:hypothetical protein